MAKFRTGKLSQRDHLIFQYFSYVSKLNKNSYTSQVKTVDAELDLLL